MKRFNMRNLWTAILAIMLIVTMMLTFAACGGNDSKEVTSVSKYKSKGNYPTLADPLSWEDINSFPIKSADMSIEELRKLCVDFFRYTKTAAWIPADNYDFFHDYQNTKADSLVAGQVYGGLPYISVASGSIYRLMDYMDEETGVVDVTTAGVNPKIFGNQCSFGAYWGWGRVINSADYNWTENMVQASGFLRVGEYTYPDITVGLSAGYQTTQILADNGLDTMYKSYAQLKAGDGIVYFTSAGHVVMIASDAQVAYAADGSIDPNASFVTVIDQGQTWGQATNEAGDSYTYQKSVDAKKTFTQLYDGHYMPFTFAEWLGTDPIEETECTFSHSDNKITVDQLFKSTVTANYGLSDIYAQVYDKKGNEVFKVGIHAEEAGMKQLRFFKNGGTVSTWGDLEELDAKKDYTVKIIAQLATGERPTLYTGEFVLG